MERMWISSDAHTNIVKMLNVITKLHTLQNKIKMYSSLCMIHFIFCNPCKANEFR